MNIDLTAEELEFRNEVRDFLATEYPQDIRRKRDEGIELSREDMVRWHKVLNQRGWFAVNWPVEYRRHRLVARTKVYICERTCGSKYTPGGAVRSEDGRSDHLYIRQREAKATFPA